MHAWFSAYISDTAELHGYECWKMTAVRSPKLLLLGDFLLMCVNP